MMARESLGVPAEPVRDEPHCLLGCYAELRAKELLQELRKAITLDSEEF